MKKLLTSIFILAFTLTLAFSLVGCAKQYTIHLLMKMAQFYQKEQAKRVAQLLLLQIQLKLVQMNSLMNLSVGIKKLENLKVT